MAPRSLLLASLLFAGAAAAQQTECKFNPYGKSCGPALHGTAQQAGGVHTLTVTMSNGMPNEMGIFVFGTRKIEVPIPVYGCSLLTDPIIVTSFATDARGAGSITLTVPPRYAATFFVQAASFSLRTVTVQASNGLEVECRLRS